MTLRLTFLLLLAVSAFAGQPRIGSKGLIVETNGFGTNTTLIQPLLTNASLWLSNLTSTVLAVDATGKVVSTNISGATSIVWSNQLWVDKAGSDSTGARNDPAHPFLTIPAAMSNALSGDAVNVGAGNFTNQVIMSNSVSLRGLGCDRTAIYGTNSLVASGGGVVLGLAPNCTVENLAVYALYTNNIAGPIGTDENNNQAVFTNVTVRNVKTGGSSDGVFVRESTLGCSARFISCLFTSQWDCVALDSPSGTPLVPHKLEFVNCELFSLGPPTLTNAFGEARAVNSLAGVATFINCYIVCTNGTTNTIGVQARSTSSVVDLINTTIITGSGTGGVYDIVATNGSTVRSFGADLSTNKSLGTVTQFPISLFSPTFAGFVTNTATVLNGVYTNPLVKFSTNQNGTFSGGVTTGTITNSVTNTLDGSLLLLNGTGIISNQLASGGTFSNGIGLGWHTNTSLTNIGGYHTNATLLGITTNTSATILGGTVTNLSAFFLGTGANLSKTANETLYINTASGSAIQMGFSDNLLSTQPIILRNGYLQFMAANGGFIIWDSPTLLNISNIMTRRITNSVAITNQSPYTFNAVNTSGFGAFTSPAQRAWLKCVYELDPSATGMAALLLSVTNGSTVITNTWGMAQAAAVNSTNTVYVPVGPTNLCGFQTNSTGTGASAIILQTQFIGE